MSGAGTGQPSRRAKHRREVKRYLQRRQNRSLRTAAASRDSALFLFRTDARMDGLGEDRAAPATEGAVTSVQEHGQRGRTKDSAVARRENKSRDEAGNCLVEPAGSAAVVAEPGYGPLVSGTEVSSRTGVATTPTSATTPTATAMGATYGDIFALEIDSDDMDDFDFLFRPKQRPTAAELDFVEGPPCSHANAIVPSSFYAEVSYGNSAANIDTIDRERGVAGSAGSLVTVPPPSSNSAPPQGPTPLSVLPVTHDLSGLGAAKALSSIHVQRVEGVPPLPAASPLATGTDMNIPTSSYLTIDPTYNMHQHAPGFTRNTKVATRSLLANAVVGWKDLGAKTTVLSTGEAMRSVFQQAYTDDKRLALRVQRIGPTVVIDTQRQPPTTVAEMRDKALLGKALYRIHDSLTDTQQRQQQQESGCGRQDPLGTGQELATVSSGTVALLPKRVGGVVSTSKAMNRYSQTLRWSIDDLKVLVGVDTPIILDRRSNAEQMLKLEDVSQHMTKEEVQRDALNCWFDATLANVPQVGIYIHNEGVVQSFEVKKVQDLLGLVEGRMATAAMNFTSNVLQWLVTQCVRDNGSYAVVRDYENDCLALYELPESGNALADLMDDGIAAGDEEEGTGATAALPSRSQHQQGNSKKAEYHTMRFNLAYMCLQMGRHLHDENDPEKYAEAIRLFLRSFAIFLQEPTAPGSAEHVTEIIEMLPSLARRLLTSRQDTGSHHSSPTRTAAVAAEPIAPDLLRDALLACTRFEGQLHHALDSVQPGSAISGRLLHGMLPCSAAFCVVATAAIDSLRCSRLARASGSTAASPVALREATGVLVEALVRLERLREAVRGYVAEEHHQQLQQQQQQQQVKQRGDGKRGKRRGSKATKSAAEMEAKAAVEPATQLAVTPATARTANDSERPVVDPTAAIETTAEVDLAVLDGSLAEVYGDVVLAVIADRSGLTRRALQEVSSGASDRGAAATATTTTLGWLAGLPADTASLSLTALRLYTRTVRGPRRTLLKTARVHFLVGHSEVCHGRFAKALEALYRARAVVRAAMGTPDTKAAGGSLEANRVQEENGEADHLCAEPPLTEADVQRALGDVYARMADLKAEVASSGMGACITLTDAQPLCIGITHALSAEEEDFLSRAVLAYGEGGWSLQQAVMLIRGASAVVGGLALAGERFTADVTAEIDRALRRAEQLGGGRSRPHQLQREWTVLQLYTCAGPVAAGETLAREASDIAWNWTQRLGGSLVVVPTDGAASAAATAAADSTDPAVPREKGFCVTLVEQHLQLALYHTVALEAVAVPERHVGDDTETAAAAVRRHQRAAAVALLAAMIVAPSEPEEPRMATLARVWAPCTPQEWAPHMAARIAQRLLLAASRPDCVGGMDSKSAATVAASQAQLAAWAAGQSLETSQSMLEEALKPFLQ